MSRKTSPLRSRGAASIAKASKAGSKTAATGKRQSPQRGAKLSAATAKKSGSDSLKPYKVPPAFRGKSGGKAMVIPADAPQPSFFALRARKLARGSTEEPLAIAKHLWLKIKVYGKGGENNLHSHLNQDHSFIILDGKARFHGPRGETRVLKRNEGILLPAGSYYWFESVGKEPLVLLRVGALVDAETLDLRVMPDGSGKVRRTAETVFISPDAVFRDDWYE
jgi:mannose-6-phosphate isomerase-like protein (cupin superfamily)